MAMGSIPTESDTPQCGQSYDKAFQFLCGCTAVIGVKSTRSNSFSQEEQVPISASGWLGGSHLQSYRQAGARASHLPAPPNGPIEQLPVDPTEHENTARQPNDHADVRRGIPD